MGQEIPTDTWDMFQRSEINVCVSGGEGTKRRKEEDGEGASVVIEQVEQREAQTDPAEVMPR